jgi:hypothetical protein
MISQISTARPLSRTRTGRLTQRDGWIFFAT